MVLECFLCPHHLMMVGLISSFTEEYKSIKKGREEREEKVVIVVVDMKSESVLSFCLSSDF